MMDDATRFATVMYAQHNPNLENATHDPLGSKCYYFRKHGRQHVRTNCGQCLLLQHARCCFHKCRSPLKTKCFESEVGNICKTKGHSCFRSICSVWVWVRQFELIWRGRIIGSCITHAPLTWDSFKLKDAATQLRGGFDKLRESATPEVCHTCNNTQKEHSVFVADAGHFLKAVRVNGVQTCLDILGHLVKQEGLPQHVPICNSVDRVTWFVPEAEKRETPSKNNLHV